MLANMVCMKIAEPVWNIGRLVADIMYVIGLPIAQIVETELWSQNDVFLLDRVSWYCIVNSIIN